MASACNTRARADATFRCGWKPRYGSTCVDGNGSTCRSTTVAADPSSADRKNETSPTVFSISASVGTIRRMVWSASRLAAAATASERTGEVAPLMRWRGDSSPVSRRTPVSSDRSARDGAVDMLCPAGNDQPSFLLSHNASVRLKADPHRNLYWRSCEGMEIYL